MLITETEALLRAMLAESGATPGQVGAGDPRAVVRVFQRFAAMPVDDVAPVEEDGDGVLAQFGTHDFRGVREFSCDLTRQLIAAGEDAPMWQLGCTLYWTTDRSTDALGAGVLWSFGMTFEEFFADVAALPGWAWAIAGAREPRDLAVTFEQV